MSVQNFDFFIYWEDYLWLHTNFTDLQTAIQKYTELSNAGAFKSKILSGLDFGGALNLSPTIKAGTAINSLGVPMVLTADEVVTLNGPTPLLAAKSLVVLRVVQSNINQIPEPLNPTNMVPLNKRTSCQLVVLNGTPDANPVYPAIIAGDVVLFGVIMPSNTSVIDASMIDYSVATKLSPGDGLLDRFKSYDAIVSLGKHGTHRNLSDLMADANIANIRKVLILDSYNIAAPITIAASNIILEFEKGKSLIKAGAANALIINGSGVEIKNGRFQDFNGVGDSAIVWNGEYGSLLTSRFKNCTLKYQDNSAAGLYVAGTFTEP